MHEKPKHHIHVFFMATGEKKSWKTLFYKLNIQGGPKVLGTFGNSMKNKVTGVKEGSLDVNTSHE